MARLARTVAIPTLGLSVATGAAQPAQGARVQLPALTAEQATALTAALDDVSRRVVVPLPAGEPRDALARALRELRAELPRGGAPELARRVRRAGEALDRLAREASPRALADTALVRLLLERVDDAARGAPRTARPAPRTSPSTGP